MKYYVNENCIGCGLCADTCPAVFSMTGENVARAMDAPVPADALADAADAMGSCPAEAIEEA